VLLVCFFLLLSPLPWLALRRITSFVFLTPFAPCLRLLFYAFFFSGAHLIYFRSGLYLTLNAMLGTMALVLLLSSVLFIL